MAAHDVVPQITQMPLKQKNCYYSFPFVLTLKNSFHQVRLFKCTLIISLVYLTMVLNTGNALRSSITYVPQGTKPLLYEIGRDYIMHLDQISFQDTVFQPGRLNSFLVEFYADWCGHCRNFAGYYKDFATRVRFWSNVVQVAAINCADPYNHQVCQANGIFSFPMIKYFSRAAISYSEGIAVEPSHSVDNLQDQLVNKIVNEYQMYSYPDWPNFKPIQVDTQTTFVDLWDGGLAPGKFLVLIFEHFGITNLSAKIILDLLPYRMKVVVRCASSTSPLVQMLSITTFPFVTLFRDNSQTAIFMDQVSPHLLQDLLIRINSASNAHYTTPSTISTVKKPGKTIIDCNKQPQNCKALYYASETDMLKAMHIALFDEVTRTDNNISGKNFTNLYNFVAFITEHFPVITFTSVENSNNEANIAALQNDIRMLSKRQILPTGSPSSGSTITMPMRNSERARLVFKQMKHVLEQRKATGGSTISPIEWKQQFENAERIFENPFPVNNSWQHCLGTTPQFRGYTCGLWTTFHVLTVHAYVSTINSDRSENGFSSLKAIQGWVNSFFGCLTCRNHFMQMTTKKFPFTEKRIKHASDAMMYLWRAHNIVNDRLHGDVTEDMQFQKVQFPPLFLCPTCHAGGHFSRRKIRSFLINYYSRIKPIHSAK